MKIRGEASKPRRTTEAESSLKEAVCRLAPGVCRLGWSLKSWSLEGGEEIERMRGIREVQRSDFRDSEEGRRRGREENGRRRQVFVIYGSRSSSLALIPNIWVYYGLLVRFGLKILKPGPDRKPFKKKKTRTRLFRP